MTPLLWLLLGAAYPVSVILGARWIDAVQIGRNEDDRFPAALAVLSPIVLALAAVWLLCLSHRKAGGK